MKRVTLILLAALLLGGCTYIQKQALPSRRYDRADLDARHLAVGDPVETTAYGFRLFTIPISMPDPIAMTDELIDRHGAVGLTDLEIEFSEFNVTGVAVPASGWAAVAAFLFQIPEVKVKGRLVRAPDVQP